MNKNYDDLLLKEIKELLKKLPPNVRIRVYYDSEGRPKRPMKTKNRSKMTISQRMDRFESTLVQISDNLTKLNQKVDKGFSELRQDIKNINARLDYNELKQLPNSK